MKAFLHDNLSAYTASDLERDLQLLPQWRREQAMRYAHLEGRRNCTLAYLLLCRALEEEYGITTQPTFIIGEHGKPSLLEYPHIHFNLSHCSTAVACAVSSRPIGIDIESTNRKVSERLVRYAMNEEERRMIMDNGEWTMDNGEWRMENKNPLGEEGIARGKVLSIIHYPLSIIKFLRLWTQKEALVKLRGTGLQDAIPDLLRPENIESVTFTTEEHLDKGYVFSIAQEAIDTQPLID